MGWNRCDGKSQITQLSSSRSVQHRMPVASNAIGKGEETVYTFNDHGSLASIMVGKGQTLGA